VTYFFHLGPHLNFCHLPNIAIIPWIHQIINPFITWAPSQWNQLWKSSHRYIPRCALLISEVFLNLIKVTVKIGHHTSFSPWNCKFRDSYVSGTPLNLRPSPLSPFLEKLHINDSWDFSLSFYHHLRTQDSLEVWSVCECTQDRWNDT
jgi:hypothetical protein